MPMSNVRFENKRRLQAVNKISWIPCGYSYLVMRTTPLQGAPQAVRL